MATFEQVDFGAGIYRGREAPAGSVYDALNALVNDEGQMFLRGKSALKSNTNASATLDMLADVYTAAGRRTVFSYSGSGGASYVLGVDDATPTALASGFRALSRPAAAGGAVFFPGVAAISTLLRAYGGSRKSATYSTGTVSVTNGSPTVTGSGTSWSANVDAGMIFSASGGRRGVVKSVDSNTQVTLFSPWSGSTASGLAYDLAVTVGFQPAGVEAYHGANANGLYLAAVGVGGRLVVAAEQRAFLSDIGDPFTFSPNSYLEIPSDSVVTGVAALQDTVILFTTGGVWALSNLDFDATDDAGNIQWQQAQISKDLILWGDAGVAAWEGVFVVPALDDVYLFGLDGSARPVSSAIRPLYRSYVKAGYQPGFAAVHRGHYFLPILNGLTWVDTLVCRLDRPYGDADMRPWTRWAGHAAGVGYVQRSSGAPKLLGLAGSRVTDLTDCLDVSGAATQDADATTPVFRVDTNDLPLSASVHPSTLNMVRAVYETQGGTPTVSLSSAVGPEGSSYAAATLKRGGGASDGTDYSAWLANRKTTRVRLRIESSSQVEKLLLRSVRGDVRETGR